MNYYIKYTTMVRNYSEIIENVNAIGYEMRVAANSENKPTAILTELMHCSREIYTVMLDANNALNRKALYGLILSNAGQMRVRREIVDDFIRPAFKNDAETHLFVAMAAHKPQLFNAGAINHITHRFCFAEESFELRIAFIKICNYTKNTSFGLVYRIFKSDEQIAKSDEFGLMVYLNHDELQAYAPLITNERFARCIEIEKSKETVPVDILNFDGSEIQEVSLSKTITMENIGEIIRNIILKDTEFKLPLLRNSVNIFISEHGTSFSEDLIMLMHDNVDIMRPF
jgi:hypothetical protein